MNKILLQTELPTDQRVVAAVLARTVSRVPNRPFVEVEGRSLTFGEFDLEVGRYAAFLADVGVLKGAHVALMLPNSLEFLLAWFACARLGALYIPINTDYRGEILRYQLSKAEVGFIVVDDRYVEHLGSVASALPRLRAAIVRRRKNDELPTKLPQEACPQVVLYDSAKYCEYEPRPYDGSLIHTDLHSICFTSGTTGPSKGVLSTNCHVVTFSMDWIKATAFSENDVIYTPLPLFHAIAAWLGVLPAILMGARIAIVERFSAKSYWGDVRRYGATIAHGIFSVIPILLKQPESPDDSTSPARVFYIGQRDPAFEKRFGCRIVNAYGSTETGAVTYVPWDEAAPQGSCGRANSSRFDVRLIGDDGAEVPDGEVGEVVVRARAPHTMMEGYFNDPGATESSMAGGWFRTGDNARRDAQGWYTFVDRKKDSIRRRGENISSFEVESIVNAHPGVLESAAVAVPSELGEDEVKVFVVRREGVALSHDELWGHCEERMPSFWVPRYIEFIDAMPRTPNQKVMKFELRRDQMNGEVRERPGKLGRRY